MSPRVMSNKGVARKDNHGAPHRINATHFQKLPDIVKRGPINQKKNRTIVGLSLQNQPHYDTRDIDDRGRRSRASKAPLRVAKRNSIETTVRSQKPKA